VTTNADHADEADEARTEILRRVRASLGVVGDPPWIERRYELSLPEGTDPIKLFAERVADYRATVKLVAPSRLARAIADSLATRAARRIVVPAGLPAKWIAAADIEAIGDSPPLTKEQLDGVDGAITGCKVAIAETGTIVLDAGPGQGRRALSLLPDYHLCVVHGSQIVGTVPQAIELLDPRTPQTWISGPSATSDIELQRVEGVHGPRNLEVLIVRD
jgi:L-lactate dehydrogenase complex protein LldG